MVAKHGTIFLIMKMASKVGPLPSCYCMDFLTSNDFGGRLSANPTSLTVGYSRTRTRIYKSMVYRRERASGKTLGGPQVYKYPLACCLEDASRGVNGSRSNHGKQWFNCLWSSVLDHKYFRSSTVSQQLVIK